MSKLRFDIYEAFVAPDGELHPIRLARSFSRAGYISRWLTLGHNVRRKRYLIKVEPDGEQHTDTAWLKGQLGDEYVRKIYLATHARYNAKRRAKRLAT